MAWGWEPDRNGFRRERFARARAALGPPGACPDEVRAAIEAEELTHVLAEAGEPGAVEAARADVQRWSVMGNAWRASLGLAEARLAYVLLGIGDYTKAYGSATSAVQRLTDCIAEQPGARFALVLAFDAKSLSALALDRKRDAFGPLNRATVLLRGLTEQYPGYGRELDAHLSLLAAAYEDLGKHEQARFVREERYLRQRPDITGDSLYARAVQLAGEQGATEFTVQAAANAVAAYHRERDVLGAARAKRHHAAMLHGAGRELEGCIEGMAAVRLWRSVIERYTPAEPWFAEAVGDLAAALPEIARMCPDEDQRRELVQLAEDLARRYPELLRG